MSYLGWHEVSSEPRTVNWIGYRNPYMGKEERFLALVALPERALTIRTERGWRPRLEDATFAA